MKKGSHHTKETKIRIGLASLGRNIGIISPAKRLDVRQKLSQSLKGKKKSKIHRKHMSESMKGRYMSKATRKKISDTLTNYRLMNPELNEKQRLLAINMIQNKSNTSIELKIKEQLQNNDIEFIPQFNVNDRFVCDFYLPDSNLIIEADGDYWHNLDRVKKRDKSKDAYLQECGYNIIRIRENVIKESNFQITSYLR